MRSELIIKSRSLAGSTDLTLLAPIKTGLVPSLESVTYKTRVKRLLKTLNTGRASSHEYALLRPFSDAVERVGKIHSVRVAVVEPDKLLLSVTFDGGFESYLRTLWQKVGTLLDVIFCNTEGYVSAWDHSFEEWADWVRTVQIETDFFYGMPGLTVDDVQYLRNDEMLRRECPEASDEALASTRMITRSVEEVAWSKVTNPETGIIDPLVVNELGRQALRSLALIHRLTSLYLPNGLDGVFLHRAARDLLREFAYLDELRVLDDVITEGCKRFDEQIKWFQQPITDRKPQIPMPPIERPLYDASDVQGGILHSYPPDISHGCLLMIAFRSRGAAAKVVDKLVGCVTRDAGKPDESLPFVNVAFTCEGLRAAGLSESQIELFPQEFREGMAARSSLLGDIRINHPRRWQLPLRNWQRPPGSNARPVELSTVHAVVQLRAGGRPVSFGETLDENDPLVNQVQDLFDGHSDIEVLSVQPMVRHFNGEGKPKEHFGFVDAIGQPVIDPEENGEIYDRNLVRLGEFLLGYPNEAEEVRDPDKAPDPSLERERQAWLHNGSFLVVRKLSQDVEALEQALENAAKPEVTGLDKELVVAKMMGRCRSGDALAGPGKENDFDYDGDPLGSACPFHAHIRRANPRQRDNDKLPPAPAGRRTPRLMRRGMSYGPYYDPKNDPESVSSPRGLVFMAYNASIAEQFEVVQRWISGGNSTGGFSGQNDPFLGVAENEQQRSFRFEHEGKVYRIPLDGSKRRLGDPRPFVRLEWGAYLFTPSIKALEKLAGVARKASGVPELAWSVSDGWEHIQRLFALEREQGVEIARDAWKVALEDPEAQDKFESASVWAAIREHCDGVLRTPYGVIVADRRLVMEVFENRHGRYTVGGYHERMMKSIGEIYLGLDDLGKGCPYQVQSRETNNAITDLKKEDAFMLARAAGSSKLNELIKREKELALDYPPVSRIWELNLSVKEIVDSVLAALCQQWFGLPAKEQNGEVVPGGARWDWRAGQPPLYPGHFTAPSRYFFQPNPGQKVQDFGCDYGEALTEAFIRFVKRHRDGRTVPTAPDGTEAPLAKAIFGAFPDRSQDELVARTMVGALMGFLPTVDGNLRLSLNEWLRDGSFWSLRLALADLVQNTPFKNAENLLEPALVKAMQLRPSPELVWRTATCPHEIGEVRVRPGDKVVVSIVSATQQCLEEGDPDVYPIFGGDRDRTLHPTHACPGYEAAMGILLGIVSALLEAKESMRPSPAPLALILEGPLQMVKPPEQKLRILTRTLQPGIGTGHMLFAEGDSWFAYPSAVTDARQDIVQMLMKIHDFQVKGTPWPTRWLKDIAADRRLTDICEDVKALVRANNPPLAIILCGGGNDVVKEHLAPLLNAKNVSPPWLNEEMVLKVVDGAKGVNGAEVDGQLRAYLVKILNKITAQCKTVDKKQIPVFIHGYDFPIPDNRPRKPTSDAWLYPSLAETPPGKGYTDLQDRIDIMKLLINRLNAMQVAVAAMPEFSSHVFHVDLTGTLRTAVVHYKEDWENELHPTESGFASVTQKFVNEMVKKLPVLQERSQLLGLPKVP